MKLSVLPHRHSRTNKNTTSKSEFDIKLLKTNKQSFQMLFLNTFHAFEKKKKKLVHMPQQ